MILESCDRVDSLRWEREAIVPGDEIAEDLGVGVVLVLGYQIDDRSGGTEGTAQGSLLGVAAGSVVKQVVRQNGIRKAGFFLQKAEDPQPDAAPSATLRMVILESSFGRLLGV